MKIPDNTKIQSIDLRIRDMNTSLDFYSNQIGLKEVERAGGVSFLSTDGNFPYLIKLVEEKDALVRMQGTVGLFHLALRFPSRKELAKVFMRLFNNKLKFQGFSDHLVSEAIYLADPDGNGVELYADKPKETWVWNAGEVMMDSLPLDLSLITRELGENDSLNGIHPETDIGHIHLNVSNLLKAEKFYGSILGFDVTNYSYPGAKFFSAGKYHHHIGANIWRTKKESKLNEDSLGMISFTIKIPDEDFLKNLIQSSSENALLSSKDKNEIEIKDFDGNKIKLVN